MLSKRAFVVAICIVLMLPLLIGSVSANAPAPSPWFTIELANLPQDTAYVDMLIPLSPEDGMYTELVTENLPDGFSAASPIVTYCEDGFRSYTFHYRDAASVIAVQPKNSKQGPYVLFFTDLANSEGLYRHQQAVEDGKYIRLAMVDAQGNILKVSQSFRVDSRKLFSNNLGEFHYDASSDTFQPETASSGFGLLLYAALSVIGVFWTVLLESVVAGFFRLNIPHGKLIRRTNILSQISMRLIYVLLYSTIFHDYVFALIILELAVYLGEWLVYRKFMSGVSGKKILLYTLTANTVSLVLGFWINQLLIV